MSRKRSYVKIPSLRKEKEISRGTFRMKRRSSQKGSLATDVYAAKRSEPDIKPGPDQPLEAPAPWPPRNRRSQGLRRDSVATT